jgi:hypothetical protein
MEPLEPVRYDTEDGRQYLEFLPAPNLFLDGDFNTNFSLLWEFISRLNDDGFGVIHKGGYNVSINGSNVIISTG